MFKLERIKDNLTTIIISVLYVFLLSKLLDIDIFSLINHEYNISNGFYYQVHFGYFLLSAIIFIGRLKKQIKIRKMEFSSRYRNVFISYVFTVLIISTNILFARNILIDNYFNILPSIFLFVIIIFNSYLQSNVYVTKDAFYTNGEMYLFHEIVSIQYNESFRINLETRKKKHKIFCVSEKKYEFIKKIVEEHTA
jgi:hypothetical protein